MGAESLLRASKASNPEGAAAAGVGDGAEGAEGDEETASKPLTGLLKFSNPVLLPNPSPKPLLKSLVFPMPLLLLVVKDPALKLSTVALGAGAVANAVARGGIEGGSGGAELSPETPPENPPGAGGGANASKPLLNALLSEPKSLLPNEPNAF